MLASIALQSVPDPNLYPFNVPAIRTLRTLEFSRSRLTFFTGENGSGKSTLLEAIALSYDLSIEGGNRNFVFDAELPQADTYPLARALRLSFRPVRSGEGFFFRAETLFNLIVSVEERGIAAAPADRSLHAHSHGEGLMALLEYRFRRSGLFLLGTPNAQILSFDGEAIHPIAYEDTPAYTVTRRFLNDPASFVEHVS